MDPVSINSNIISLRGDEILRHLTTDDVILVERPQFFASAFEDTRNFFAIGIFSTAGDLKGFLIALPNYPAPRRVIGETSEVENALIKKFNSKIAYVASIAVNPVNCGYGKLLFNHMIDDCSQWNKKPNAIILHVKSDNINAIKFYKKQKFSEHSLVKKYYDNADAYIYVRILNEPSLNSSYELKVEEGTSEEIAKYNLQLEPHDSFASANPNIASKDPAEKAIQDFARKTGVDEALAHFFLQDYGFQLELGLKEYERQVVEKGAPQLSHPNIDEFPEDITVVSYNVDGLDIGNLKTRFQGVVHVIAKINPEVILLQEVVDEHMDIINEVMAPMYHVITPLDKGMPYFTVTLVSKNISCRVQEVKPFHNTSMGRTMTVFEGFWQKLHLVVIHSHLESMREHVAARKEQFSECMKKMEENMDPNTLVIFAGDLNIHDTELPVIHPQIKDAWIAAGSKTDTRYTWDNMKNNNKNLPRNIRCRFDRIYFNGPYKKVDFSLAGTQQILKILQFPSDHFAVVTKLFDPVD